MEIYTYGNVEAVIGVLHYLVMLFGTDDFMDIVKTAIVIGFIVAACASVMQMTHRGWKWMLTVMLVYAICFIPKTSVLVTDKLAIEPPAVVANVPWLAGFLFAVKSQIGHTLVQLTETALQTIPNPKYALPAELSYERHGVAFGNRLIRETRVSALPDTQLRADVIAYIRNCVYPEVGKSIDPNALAKAIPLWPALAVANPALVTTYTPVASVLTVSPCPDVYLAISGRLPAEATTMLELIAANLSPGVALAAAVAEVGPAIEAAYVKTMLANAAMSAGDILLHNAMINHFAETGQVMASAASDPAAVLMSIAKSQSTAQSNASYMLQARMADEASPVVRNVLEILLLGFFPVVCVMLLVTEGARTLRFLVGYLYALIWVELWPFTYALLNYVHTIYASKEIAAQAFLNPGNALALMTSGIVYSTTLSTSAIAGWMIIAVPALSAALIWGFDKIISAVPSLASMLGSAGSTAAAAAVGNISQSNLAFGQQSLSPQRSSAWFASVQDDLRGDIRVFGMSGISAIRALQNESFISGRIEAQNAATLREQASSAEESAIRESTSASFQLAAAWGDALTKGSARSSVKDLATVVGREKAASDTKQWNEIVSSAKQYNARWNVTEAQAATIVASARAGLSLGGAELGARLGLDSTQMAAVRRDYDEIRSNTSTEQVQTTQDFLQRLSTNEQYRAAVVSSVEDRHQLSARFDKVASHVRSAEASLVARDALVKSAETAQSRAASLGYDWTRDPMNEAFVRRGMDAVRQAPNQADLWATTELARFQQLSHPTQYLGGAQVVGDQRARYTEYTADARLRDTTGEADVDNRRRLGPASTRPVAPPAHLSNAGTQIQERSVDLDKKRNDLDGRLADQGNEVTQRLDRLDGVNGKFGTKASLANRAGENFVNDVNATNQKAADGLKRDADDAVNKLRKIFPSSK